jgi:hypothetical protein
MEIMARSARLRSALERFSFSKAVLAEIFDCSREGVHSWAKFCNPRDTENFERNLALAEELHHSRALDKYRKLADKLAAIRRLKLVKNIVKTVI